MKLLTKLLNSGSLTFYSEHFRVFLESHIGYFKEMNETQVKVIDPHHLYRYEGDLYGYLRQELKIDSKYHWFIMRLNNYFSSEDFRHDYKTGPTIVRILIPSLSEIDTLYSVYKTQHASLS